MPRIAVAVLLLLPSTAAVAQDPLEVVGGLGEMVDAALSERARELWKERDALVLRLDSAARIEERQRYVRERLVGQGERSLDFDPGLGRSRVGMTSWKQLRFDPGPQDAEQVLPGFLARGLDSADFALAFAPRPFHILAATRDFFPIVGARSAHEEARRACERLGHAGRVGFFEYDDAHGWSKPRREATYRRLERWLHDRVDDGTEPAIDTELESDLYATPTGQVSTSYPGLRACRASTEPSPKSCSLSGRRSQAGRTLRARCGERGRRRPGRRHRGPGPLRPRRAGPGPAGDGGEPPDLGGRELRPGMADAPARAPRGPDTGGDAGGSSRRPSRSSTAPRAGRSRRSTPRGWGARSRVAAPSHERRRTHGGMPDVTRERQKRSATPTESLKKSASSPSSRNKRS